MSKNIKKKILVVLAFILMLAGCFCGMYFDNQELNDSISTIQNIVNNEIEKYEMSEEEISELSSTEIIEQSVEDEQNQEQEVENEAFELQGNVAYEGDKARSWNVELGDYKGLTYYSQIDSRWKNKMYSSTNNYSQTIGSSGCGPTSASMIVTACKGAITPDKMADLFVQYGYRSANDGTYWSAFRAIADEFDINYKETYNFDTAINLLRNNHYIVCSVGNGLFTTGGHFIVLTGIENDIIRVYDPYLYAGKFELSTRRGKATVSGNTVYVSIDNFRNYANYKCFFCYKHDEEVHENNTKPVVTQSYTRYVNVNTSLNVRAEPNTNSAIVASLYNNDIVTVYENINNWSRIGDSRWVCSDYLSTVAKNTTVQNTVSQTRKLARNCTLYSNSNLSGIQYSYLAKTQVTILENVSSSIDKIRVNATGRIAYINTSNYSNYSVNTVRSTVNQYRKLKMNCTLYSNSNLTGIRYSYLANTQVKILRNVSSTVDYIYIPVTGRYAYIRNNLYK